MKHYGSSLWFTLIALVAGFIIGGWAGVAIIGMLGVLETSLSFDNAIVNASILKNWDDVWRHRFLTWGMPVAVFGMRLVFPLAIVGVVAHLGPIDAITLTVHDPKQYETILTSVHHEIAAFGGAFLMMIFLKFFFDTEKDTHWLSWIEAPLTKIGRLDCAEIAITLVTILVTAAWIDGAEKVAFISAGVYGLVTYIVAEAVGTLVGGSEAELGTKIVKQGIAGLLYLELLDASFSFDGVIASFALTNEIFVMMLGLSIGAMFVRSMTIHLVETGTLSEYRYLESGAFWAIGALATIMFIGAAGFEVPEIVTGLIGAVSIAAAFLSSVMANKNDPVPAVAAE